MFLRTLCRIISLKGGDTYRVDNKSAQQSPSFQSQPRQQYQQQYAVMNSHSALTENPEALQALYQMQQPYEIQVCIFKLYQFSVVFDLFRIIISFCNSIAKSSTRASCTV
jgi:hypothetical protein